MTRCGMKVIACGRIHPHILTTEVTPFAVRSGTFEKPILTVSLCNRIIL